MAILQMLTLAAAVPEYAAEHAPAAHAAAEHASGGHDPAAVLMHHVLDQPFLGNDRCVSDEFVQIAGANAEGVVCAFPWNPQRDDPDYLAFCERFRQRFQEEPETYAAHAYDGMNMLLWSIQAAGLNRARIRDVIAFRTEPWKGVTGDILFSSVLDDIGEVYLARRENGELIRAFLERTADAAAVPVEDWGGWPGFGQSDSLGRQILPGEAGADGFYYAALTKR